MGRGSRGGVCKPLFHTKYDTTRLMSGMTVVLGWDALDHELVREYHLEGSFGPAHTGLETFDNPYLGEPHTYEVWPSIITGRPPEAHGIRVESEAGVDWRNPVLSTISQYASRWVPRDVRTGFGLRLQNRGVELDFKSAGYFHDQGIETVFDGRTARPVAVPNYRVPADDELDILFDRGAQLKEFLRSEKTSDGNKRSTPTASLSRLEERLAAEAAGKLGVVRSAVQREYDLVFVWLGFLDTIGHVAPVAAETDPGWQERAYRMAARWTEDVKRMLQPEDRVFCVSDHGLQDGDHTHNAFLGAPSEELLDGAESVLDVRDVLENATESHRIIAEPPVRAAYSGRSSTHARTPEDVENRLSNLGYL
ncbi:alkaline phosphatase family protein [Halococcus hamelinensis]|uniref:alkaline phosphatase family protein n=1 Tax=Halococcus hamelinensis TaxID=332168 RepID=UPI001EF9F1E0|nr:alkaline phosphatase family protein [Halococcus hamelinensis]